MLSIVVGFQEACRRFLETRTTAFCRSKEDGFTTAELLMNAALGVSLLVGVYVILRAAGFDIANWIKTQVTTAKNCTGPSC